MTRPNDPFYDMLENSIILTNQRPVTNFDAKYTAERNRFVFSTDYISKDEVGKRKKPL